MITAPMMIVLILVRLLRISPIVITHLGAS
jgi:hypothetical protein